MADVFLSYAEEDREVAQRLSMALQDRRLSVWWDREIHPGELYQERISRELDAARCVVVLWSSDSVKSTFVRDEASRALRRNVLVSTRIEEVEVPLGFGQHQLGDLLGWEDLTHHAGFEKLVEGIEKRLEPGSSTPRPSRDTRQRHRLPLWRRILVAGRFIISGSGYARLVALGLLACAAAAAYSPDYLPAFLAARRSGVELPPVPPPALPPPPKGAPVTSPQRGRSTRVPKWPAPVFCASYRASTAEQTIAEADNKLANGASARALEGYLCAYEKLPQDLKRELTSNPANVRWLDDAFEAINPTPDELNRTAAELRTMFRPIRATLKDRRQRSSGEISVPGVAPASGGRTVA